MRCGSVLLSTSRLSARLIRQSSGTFSLSSIRFRSDWISSILLNKHSVWHHLLYWGHSSSFKRHVVYLIGFLRMRLMHQMAKTPAKILAYWNTGAEPPESGYKRLQLLDIVERASRPSTKTSDEEKCYWSMTERGLRFGKNLNDPVNLQQTILINPRNTSMITLSLRAESSWRLLTWKTYC